MLWALTMVNGTVLDGAKIFLLSHKVLLDSVLINIRKYVFLGLFSSEKFFRKGRNDGL